MYVFPEWPQSFCSWILHLLESQFWNHLYLEFRSHFNDLVIQSAFTLKYLSIIWFVCMICWSVIILFCSLPNQLHRNCIIQHAVWIWTMIYYIELRRVLCTKLYVLVLKPVWTTWKWHLHVYWFSKLIHSDLFEII